MAVVHGVSPSPFVRKVMVFLREKNLPFDNVPVMPANPAPGFVAKSPLGKVPLYTEEDFALPDSSVICAYLERVHPAPPLYPAGPRDYGRALWLEEYADTRLMEASNPIFFERLIAPNLLGREPDQEKIDAALNTVLPQVCAYFEGQLKEGEDWLVGGAFSIADIAVASPYLNLFYGGVRVEAAQYPKLAAFLARVFARPGFQAQMVMDRQVMPGVPAPV